MYRWMTFLDKVSGFYVADSKAGTLIYIIIIGIVIVALVLIIRAVMKKMDK
ncbi:MAG: hypothetical protein K6E85_07170 [Lachnospiraceae bacterium]|nr:hypothetical protein [Lachnospiraceae bacterium]